MKWITLQLMRYQLKKAKKRHEQEGHYILAMAYRNLIKSYETTIFYLDDYNK
jgi:hypothetical protein